MKINDYELTTKFSAMDTIELIKTRYDGTSYEHVAKIKIAEYRGVPQKYWHHLRINASNKSIEQFLQYIENKTGTTIARN